MLDIQRLAVIGATAEAQTIRERLALLEKFIDGKGAGRPEKMAASTNGHDRATADDTGIGNVEHRRRSWSPEQRTKISNAMRAVWRKRKAASRKGNGRA